MRYLVTPEFNTKLTSLSTEGLAAVSAIASRIKTEDKNALLSRSSEDVSVIGTQFMVIRSGSFAVYGTFGSDAEGEYVLLLDVAFEGGTEGTPQPFFTANNPQTNSLLNPALNIMIDPNHNMLIDPRRNMLIDPNRNMLIDPRRNMLIDPRRNMMIDPNRNMMIDPRRNMLIDPNRNMLIDPNRNRLYGGPYVYTTDLRQTGFVVKTNEQVSLIFDLPKRFSGFFVGTGESVANVFDTDGGWRGFLVSTGGPVRLSFDTLGNWTGLIV